MRPSQREGEVERPTQRARKDQEFPQEGREGSEGLEGVRRPSRKGRVELGGPPRGLVRVERYSWRGRRGWEALAESQEGIRVSPGGLGGIGGMGGVGRP